MQESKEPSNNSDFFLCSEDKFKNVHLTLKRSPKCPVDCDMICMTLQKMQADKRKGKVNAVYLNIPFSLDFDLKMLGSIVPTGFPISPVRDTQKGMMRFLDAPSSVPTGGNVDLGATAIVWDPLAKKVLTVTDRRSGRVQYPGGRWDPEDDNAVNAARRECLEEANYTIPVEAEFRVLGIQYFPVNQAVPGYNLVFLFQIPGAAEQSASTIRGDGAGGETSSADWRSLEEVRKVLPNLDPEWLEGDSNKGLCERQRKGTWYEFWA